MTLNMKKWLIKNKLWFIGGLVGSIAGYTYYYFIGCASGSCAITSNPINSTLYGLLMGAILFSMFEAKPESKNNV
jgi:phage shock protein E